MCIILVVGPVICVASFGDALISCALENSFQLRLWRFVGDVLQAAVLG